MNLQFTVNINKDERGRVVATISGLPHPWDGAFMNAIVEASKSGKMTIFSDVSTYSEGDGDVDLILKRAYGEVVESIVDDIACRMTNELGGLRYCKFWHKTDGTHMTEEEMTAAAAENEKLPLREARRRLLDRERERLEHYMAEREAALLNDAGLADLELLEARVASGEFERVDAAGRAAARAAAAEA